MKKLNDLKSVVVASTNTNTNTIPVNSSNLESIKVGVRIRPFLKTESNEGNIIYTDPDDDRKIHLLKQGQCFEGFFDKIFSMKSTQDEIFNFVKDSIEDVQRGINSTIFTYGQTGSGKTYTMFGSDWTLNEISDSYPLNKKNISYDHQNFIK